MEEEEAAVSGWLNIRVRPPNTLTSCCRAARPP